MSSVAINTVRDARLRLIEAKYAQRIAVIEFECAQDIAVAVRESEMAYENPTTRQLVRADLEAAKKKLAAANLELNCAESELRLAKTISATTSMAKFNAAGERFFLWVERLLN